MCDNLKIEYDALKDEAEKVMKKIKKNEKTVI
jgi:predicted ATP-grasp superfamily ATP-dependent carboligase